MPGFRQVMLAIAEACAERRRELESAGERLADALNRARPCRLPRRRSTSRCSTAGAGPAALLRPVNGGFDAPKFPQPMNSTSCSPPMSAHTIRPCRQ